MGCFRKKPCAAAEHRPAAALSDAVVENARTLADEAQAVKDYFHNYIFETTMDHR